MCSRIGTKRFSPKEIFPLKVSGGKSVSIWGFNDGLQYNARSEKLYTSYKRLAKNKGVLTIESFWEAGREFINSQGQAFHLATITNEQNEFAILTMDSIPEVKKFHHRMPVILNPDLLETFLNTDIPVAEALLNPELVILREPVKIGEKVAA